MPKQAFAGKLKKGEKYHASGITSWPNFPLPMKMYLLMHNRQGCHTIK
jgi:hypothetical protein